MTKKSNIDKVLKCCFQAVSLYFKLLLNASFDTNVNISNNINKFCVGVFITQSQKTLKDRFSK